MLRTFILLVLLSISAIAEASPLNASLLPGMTPAGSSVATLEALPAVPLSEEKRPVALALGIALVLITFYRALGRRQRA